jgi:hypothetical protein
VISRSDKHRSRQIRHDLVTEYKIIIDIRTIHADVAGMNDEIRILTDKPVSQGLPVAHEMRLPAAKMGI